MTIPALADEIYILKCLGSGNRSALKNLQASAVEAEALFLSAVFEPGGEKAASLYQQIHSQFPDNILVWESISRLSEYYYSIGAFAQSQELQTLLEKRPPESRIPATVKNIASAYWIQTGAFSTRANAEKQLKQVKSLNYSALLSEKKIEGKRLFIVRAGKFPDEKSALEASARIEKRLKIKTRILPEE